MKKVFWLLLAALLIWAWKNPEKVRNSKDIASKWVGENSRWLADKLAPVEGGESKLSSHPGMAQELPEGMYVLLQDVMISTKTDVVKWPAGTSIRKLGEGAGKILVSDGVNQTTVDASILTRDLQDRKALYKRIESNLNGQAKQNAQNLERELAAVEAKILSLQSEKRKIQLERQENPNKARMMSTDPNFLELAIKAQEERRLEIYKQLGRSTPQMLIAR